MSDPIFQSLLPHTANESLMCYTCFDKEQVSDKSFYVGGAACGINREDIHVRAYAEYIERQSYYNAVNILDLKESTYNDLSLQNKVVKPSTLSPFLKKQFKNNKFNKYSYTNSIKMNWVEVLELITNNNYYLPSSIFTFERKNRLFPIDTIGTAAHSNPSQALMNAVYELIERDALSLSFYNYLSGIRLDIETVTDKNVQQVLQFLKEKQISVYTLDITTDIAIPTVLTILISKHNEKLVIAAGAGTNTSIFKAIEKSLLESYLCYCVVNELKKNIYTIQLGEFYSRLNPVSKRLWWWLGREKLLSDLQSALEDLSKNKIESMALKVHSLSELCTYLEIRGVQKLYTLELQSKPLRVYRVYSPDLAMLTIDSNYPYLNYKRLIKDKKKNIKKLFRKYHISNIKLIANHFFP